MTARVAVSPLAYVYDGFVYFCFLAFAVAMHVPPPSWEQAPQPPSLGNS